MVASDSNEVTGFESGSALTAEDRSSSHKLPGKTLHAEKFWIAVATVSGTALSFLMCHKSLVTKEWIRSSRSSSAGDARVSGGTVCGVSF